MNNMKFGSGIKIRKLKRKEKLEKRLKTIEEKLNIGEKDIVLKGAAAVVWRAFENLLIGNGKLYALKDGTYLFTTQITREIDTRWDCENELLRALKNYRYWE